MFQRQSIHAVSLAVLLLGILLFFHHRSSATAGALWGLSTTAWLWITIAVPVIHQVYVLIFWRLELYGKRISGTLGEHGFLLYKTGFTVLILLRPVTLTILAISNAGTAAIDPPLNYILSVVLFLPAAYTFYSVRKYFGFDRAYGIDHFQPEKYRNAPLVKQGMFRYTSNSMYVFGFLILWVPGVLLRSQAALAAALFQHLYIWVHYYCTEQPDMEYIYNDASSRGE